MPKLIVNPTTGELDQVRTDDEISALAGGGGPSNPDAEDVSYDNTSSGLAATDVQDAVDEVESRLDTAESNVSTNSSNISSNDTDIATNASNISTNATNLQDHIDETSGAHASSAVSYSGLLTGSNAEEALDDAGSRIENIELGNPVSGTFSHGDNEVLRWDQSATNAAQSSGVTIDDSNNISTPGSISLNSGNTQAVADTAGAGLEVQLTDATNASITYDSLLASKFKIGETGTTFVNDLGVTPDSEVETTLLGGTDAYAAIGFTPSSNVSVNDFVFKGIYNSAGTSTGTLVCDIVGATGINPDETNVLATSVNSIDVGQLPTAVSTALAANFVFPETPLTASTDYYFLLRFTSYTGDSVRTRFVNDDTSGVLNSQVGTFQTSSNGGTSWDTTPFAFNGVGALIRVSNNLSSEIITATDPQSLLQKTMESPTVNGNISGTAILDEDDMVSDSATKLATQQSIKAYVDSAIGTEVSVLTNADSPYTALSTDELLLVNAAAGNVLVNLPSAAVSGKQYVIKKTDNSTNTVTVDPSGSETLDGETTLVLDGTNSLVGITSDGSNWQSTGPAPNLIETKALAADQTSAGNMPSITFSNLTIGKWYHATGEFLFFQDDGAAANNIAVTTNHDGSILSRLSFRIQEGTDTSEDRVSLTLNRKFRATATTLTFDTEGASSFKYVLGNGTTLESYVQLEERNDLAETDKF